MSSSTCNCQPDLVDTYAASVVAELAKSADDARKEIFRNAQKDLIGAICCDKAHSAVKDSILWVNTYVELAEELEERLKKASGQKAAAGVGGSPQRFVLFAPAGIGLDQNEVNNIHGVLDTHLNSVPRNSWMSYRLASSTTPPLVTFLRANDSVTSHPSGLQVFPDFYAQILFSNGREQGRYLHIAHPAREQLQALVDLGPAGVYLFLKDQNARCALPNCLIRHLRSFLQVLVTAQLSLAARHLYDAVIEATRIFRSNPGLLRDFAEAAKQLATLGDPLEITTHAFDEAQKLAEAMFSQKPTSDQHNALEVAEKGVDKLHTVGQWMVLPQDAKAALAKLKDALKEVVKKHGDGSAVVITAIATAIEDNVNKGTAESLEAALRHAKALDHHSVTVRLLVSNDGAPLETMAPFYGVGEKSQEEQAFRWLRQAIVELWGLRDTTRYCEQNEVDWVAIEWQFEIDTLVTHALSIKDGVSGVRASDCAPTCARILRGLRGTSTGSVTAKAGQVESFSKLVREQSRRKSMIVPFSSRIEK